VYHELGLDFLDSISTPQQQRLLDRMSPAQQAILGDYGETVVTYAPRRAGKTTVHAAAACLLGRPDETHPIIGPTKSKVKQLYWPEFKRLQEQGWNIKLNAAELTATMPNGAVFQAFGASCDADIEIIRGIRCPLAIIEEAGTIKGERLKVLLEEILSPTLMDFYGRGGRGVFINGTPNMEWNGYWHRLCKGEFEASVHRLSLEDNPLFADGRAAEFLEARLRKYNWTRETPAFRREYLGEFCIDSEGLCYKSWNGEILPDNMVPCDGVAYLGMDFGLNDPNTWVVIVCAKNQVHVVYAYEEAGMTHHQIAAKTREVRSRFRVAGMWGDSYGTGAQTIHTLRNSFALPIEPAKYRGANRNAKDRILFVDSMLASRTMHLHEGAADVGEEWRTIPWNDDQTNHHESYNNHRVAGLHCAVNSIFQAHPLKFEETPEEKVIREAAERKKRMFNKASKKR
jgi:hypothetical protein